MANEQRDDLTTEDGRKITSFSAGGESYNIESAEQAAKGKLAELEAALATLRAGFNPLKYWQGYDRSQRR